MMGVCARVLLSYDMLSSFSARPVEKQCQLWMERYIVCSYPKDWTLGCPEGHSLLGNPFLTWLLMNETPGIG